MVHLTQISTFLGSCLWTYRKSVKDIGFWPTIVFMMIILCFIVFFVIETKKFLIIVLELVLKAGFDIVTGF